MGTAQRAGAIELTDPAASAMKAALRKARAQGVRVAVDGGAYSLTLEDGPRPSELTLEDKGVPLFVMRGDRGKMAGLRIDYVKDGGREGFTIKIPGGCGCGPDCACGS